ncbi:hypothetical protein ASD15_24165 [Massilia sp. Root351]|jgi:hypothetical protein|uniref:T6SS immunity protein Tli4 family protein n=1 Tax=Massilia sp. Root351 TaxID=1736522 RepID=UPI00070C2898|nr:T6SS immunity protein Tli4 family protein [Massilia sp. Root351]KQV89813.1 hypothetical protein ASD15_24165 [Massilia sp. Root351]
MTVKTGGYWAKRWRLWGGVLVLIAGARLVKIIQEDQMKMRIAEMPMKTVCVGRFLIDVPKHAIVSFGATRLAGWSISVDYDETDDAFEARLAATETELRTMKNEKGWNSLESVANIIADGLSGKVMLFDREWGYLVEFGERVYSTSAKVRGLARLHGVSFEFRAEALDSKDIPELVRIIKQVRNRDGEAIPSESGFCFDNSLVADPLHAGQNESTVMFVGLQSHPDLSIALRSTAGIAHGRTLLQRDADTNFRSEYRWSVHNFRLGDRIVNGIPGQELMDRIREHSGVTGHDFEWEALSKKDSVFTPNLGLEMSTGHGRPGAPVQSSLSDVEAIALWDKILSSLRVRPTRAVPAAAAASQAPVWARAD